ncbi:MAG: LruC domain-containing protein [Bacteroidales bacterium]|nr:LruC domain-containing protein [Bacteroidales bacterium]
MKKIKLSFSVLMMALIAVITISCEKNLESPASPDPSTKKFTDLVVPENFTWSTASFLLIDLKFVDANQNPVVTTFEIYSEYPNGIKFMDGVSNTDGVFIRKYKIANYRTSITVVIPNEEAKVITFNETSITVGELTTEAFEAKQTFVVSNPGLKSITDETYQYYPAEGQFGTLAFEDTWPNMADYDFNDVVLDYNVMGTYDEDWKVTKINMVLYLRASGANSQDDRGSGVGISFKHSWCYEGEPYADIATVTVNGESISPEASDYPSFILIANVEDYQPTYNTFADQSFVYPVRFDVEIVFDSPAEDWWDVELPLNNLFIFDSKDRGRETHLPWFLPTSLANPDLAGTAMDFSDPLTFDPNNFKAGNMMVGYYTYMTVNGYPWGLDVYFDEGTDDLFLYPVEFTDIREAYEPAFSGWVENWDPWDWYSPEYQVSGKVYESLPDPGYPEMQ